MLTKEKVIKAVSKLPKKFSLDMFIEELLLLEKIDRGLSQSNDNEIISDAKLDNVLHGEIKRYPR